MSRNLATHRHLFITGVYRHCWKWAPWHTGVEFWCEHTEIWRKATASFKSDLIELNNEEKAAL